MKIIKIFTLGIIGILLFVTCDDSILDVTNPNNATKGSYFTLPEHGKEAVTAAYSSLQNWGLFKMYYYHVAGIKSQEAKITSFGTGAGAYTLSQLVSYETPSNNDENLQIWRDSYSGIYRSNEAIDNLNKMKNNGVFDKDTALYNNYLGQVYFLRGFYHFITVLNYGERIVLREKNPEKREDYYKSLCKPGEAWTLIVADLKLAKSLLPVNQVDKGRVSKYSASGMLGKVYLYMTSSIYNPSDNNRNSYYTLAAAEFKDVIDNSGKSLTTNFRDNHDYKNENNSESLFEVQFNFFTEESESGTYVKTVSENGSVSTNEGSLRAREAGYARDIGYSWINEAVSPKTYNEFERYPGTDSIADPRCFMSIWCPNGANYIEYTTSNKFFDTISYDEAKARGGWLAGDYEYGWRKFCYDIDLEYYNSKWGTTDDINYRILRLSDIYLMYAECKIALGDNAEASIYINLVRARATNPISDPVNKHLSYVKENKKTNGIVTPLPTVEELIASAPTINGIKIDNYTAALRHERYVELAGECHRWYDIIRWDIGSEVITSSQFQAPADYFLPIPQSEVENNPKLLD